MRRPAFCLAVLFAGLIPTASAADVEKQRAVLDYGLWNDRVRMLYDLGEEGREGLPLLVYSSDDADWQMRLTAVHFMGKLGPAAAPFLGEIVRVEPCPRVRVAALRWLTGMGSVGRMVLDQVMTPEDEREMESIPDRFGTERMGRPIVIDSPGGAMTAEFFHRGLDLRVCASSEYANRRKRPRPPVPAWVPAPAPAAAPAAGRARRDDPPRPDSFEPVSTPPVRPARPAARTAERLPDAPPAQSVALIDPETTAEPYREPSPPPRAVRKEPREPYREPALQADTASVKSTPQTRPEAPLPSAEDKRRGAEIPDIRGVKTPETLPPAGPGFERRANSYPDGRFGAAPEPRPVAAAAPRAPRRAAETMPVAPPGIHHEPAEPGRAEVVGDAGTGTPENDPIPELIKRLSSPEPRTRARAADELGKRGAAALPAVPALRRALKDRDRRVRASAVLALGGVAGSVDGVVGELRRALRDKNEDVRFSAVIALERLR